MFWSKNDLPDRVLKSIMAVAADPVFTVDDKGFITNANHHAYRVFGWAPGSLLFAHLDDLIPERYLNDHHKYRSDYLKDPDTRATRPMGKDKNIYAIKRDGTEFPVEVGLTPIGPSSRPGSLVMAYVKPI